MKKQFVLVSVVGAFGTLIAGGCASHEVVKKDEAIATSTISQAKQATDKTVKNSTATTASPVKQATVVGSAPQSAKKEAPRIESQTNEPVKSALDRIYFDFDSSALSEQARNTLAKDSDYLRKNTSVKARIEGNCDERGSDEYNLALGEQRAKAAKKYLVTLGIQEDRLATISYGKEKPVEPGHDESAWAKNRRDELVVSTK